MQVVRNPRVNPMAQTMRLPASVARAAAAGGRKGDLSRPQLRSTSTPQQASVGATKFTSVERGRRSTSTPRQASVEAESQSILCLTSIEPSEKKADDPVCHNDYNGHLKLQVLQKNDDQLLYSFSQMSIYSPPIDHQIDPDNVVHEDLTLPSTWQISRWQRELNLRTKSVF